MSPNYHDLSQSRALTRVSLRWLPEPPFENTETLVLMVGEWYVDLRVDKQSGALDWAIAGQCLLKDTDPRRIVFTHTIDSNGNFNVSNPCPFIPLLNGYDLETGAMPRPDVPGKPVTEYEEVWRYLSKKEIGMGEMEKPIAWILESEEDVASHYLQGGTTTFLARIEGRHLALQQMRTDDRGKPGDSDWEENITGGEVISIASDFDCHVQYSWAFTGQKVTVKDRRYVVRAFDVADVLSKPTQLAKI
ncbi:uncharacterized protein N7496_000173 [Penicillium cataractarum]|uniref:Protein HRI1 n=1 Tax=Penicillium cataractarum TaxID=2100454 RepID=A0A9X0B5Q7_9EURO|nr:uncharacterized protein N7496_000173 [Penicillium cataractarum]KAJ5389105.1 hypothetical protein N7496_000173 [Penicillium cataractarum]